MKPSRLARRFNKKGRQQKAHVVLEENPLANVCWCDLFPFRSRFLFTQVIVEGETTTADNQSILPSKKRLTRVVKSAAPVKRKLSKKERKRLEKVLDVKKKKAKVSSSNRDHSVASLF